MKLIITTDSTKDAGVIIHALQELSEEGELEQAFDLKTEEN